MHHDSSRSVGIYAALKTVDISSSTSETQPVTFVRFTHMFGYGVQPLTCRLMISKGEVQFAGNPGEYYKRSESATLLVIKQPQNMLDLHPQ